MARLEIEESDLANLQGLEGAIKEIMGNPEARKMLLHARKVANPRVQIPEIDAAAPFVTAIEGIHAKMDAWQTEQRKKEEEREQNERIRAFQTHWEGQKDELRKQGWRANGITEVEKFAQENQIMNLQHAAAAWEKMHPQPDAASGGNGIMDLFGGASDPEDTFVEDMMKSGGNNEARLNKEIQATIAAVRANR